MMKFAMMSACWMGIIELAELFLLMMFIRLFIYLRI